jgi:hypothetical protein
VNVISHFVAALAAGAAMISRVSTVAIVMLFMAFAFLQRSFHPHVAALTEVAGDPF